MGKVIFILIDACRADALKAATTPNIDTLIQGGASTFCAETVNPPLTLPVHFSIFTSVKPLNHDVLTNISRPASAPIAWSIMDLAKYNGRTTAAFYSWEQLRNLWMPGSVDYGLCMNSVADADHDLKIADAAAQYIRRQMPDFCYVYLEKTDWAGHKSGFMSDAYLSAIEMADRAVGMILAGLDKAGVREEYAILIHSDHGGIGFHHEEDRPEVTTVPWIVAGPEIQAGLQIGQPVSVLDTAPTIARLLNIRPHHNWEGKAVDVLKGSTVRFPEALAA